MNAATRVWNAILDGLIFGFTFAIGWIAALVAVGAVVA